MVADMGRALLHAASSMDKRRLELYISSSFIDSLSSSILVFVHNKIQTSSTIVAFQIARNHTASSIDRHSRDDHIVTQTNARRQVEQIKRRLTSHVVIIVVATRTHESTPAARIKIRDAQRRETPLAYQVAFRIAARSTSTNRAEIPQAYASRRETRALELLERGAGPRGRAFPQANVRGDVRVGDRRHTRSDAFDKANQMGQCRRDGVRNEYSTKLIDGYDLVAYSRLFR